MRRTLVVGVLLHLVATPLLHGQERLPWFAGLGLGPVRRDQQGNHFLPPDGNFYEIHGGWQWSQHLGARVDLMRASIEGNNDIVIDLVPCPDAPTSCPRSYLGPVRVTGLSSGVEASWSSRRFLLLAGVGPGLYWLTDRPPNTRYLSAGVRLNVGGSYQLASRLWAVMGIQYHRLFTDGGSPRWLVPGSIGLEVR
jgi:hypothetical protein